MKLPSSLLRALAGGALIASAAGCPGSSQAPVQPLQPVVQPAVEPAPAVKPAPAVEPAPSAPVDEEPEAQPQVGKPGPVDCEGSETLAQPSSPQPVHRDPCPGCGRG